MAHPAKFVGFRDRFVNENLRPHAVEVAVLHGEDVETMRLRHLERALQHVAVRGRSLLHLEFGVHDGRSINHLASLVPAATWHGFDSFEGMPANTKDLKGTHYMRWTAGMYSRQGHEPAVRPNVQLHKGWFEQTLPPFLASAAAGTLSPGASVGASAHGASAAAFVHLDADLYSSTRTVLEELCSRCLLRNGSVLAFDELYGNPSLFNHEWKALRESAERRGFEYRFVTWMLHPKSRMGRAALRITAPPRACRR